MEDSMIFSKTIKVRSAVDVLVAGGGPAGVAAATVCARQGKKVFLVEESGSFGGLGTVGMVPELMNFDDGENFLAGGIGKEISDALFGEITLNRSSFVVDTERLKRLYDELVISSGAKFSFFTKVIGVEKSTDDTIEYAILSAPSGMFAVKASVFIDCTGSGELCAMADAEFEIGNENGLTMPGTLCSLWGDIDFHKTPLRDDCKLKEAIEDGIITVNDRLLPGIKRIYGSIGGGNVGHCFNINPIDENSLTQAIIEARKNLKEYERYYKEYLTGYENMFLCATSNMLGIRESRRIIGDSKLIEKHYYEKSSFEDEIGRYSYLIDIHIEKPDDAGYDKFLQLISMAHGKGDSYGIPYGALIPKKLRNVLVAGKCISADRKMQASVRVIPCCYITGQAAGVAAALACDFKGDVRGFDVSVLRSVLKKNGAFLPEIRNTSGKH
mgnify:CR=1 FL=1